MPEFGEAVDEQDQRAGAGLEDLLAKAVGLDVAGLHFAATDHPRRDGPGCKPAP
jgi:hypothetical protein